MQVGPNVVQPCRERETTMSQNKIAARKSGKMGPTQTPMSVLSAFTKFHESLQTNICVNMPRVQPARITVIDSIEEGPLLMLAPPHNLSTGPHYVDTANALVSFFAGGVHYHVAKSKLP